MSMPVQVVVQRRLVTPAISVTGIADSTASWHAIIKVRPKSRGKALIWQCSSARWPIQLRGLTGTDHMLRNGRRAPNRITLSIDNVGIWTRPIAAAVRRSAFRLPASGRIIRKGFSRSISSKSGPACLCRRMSLDVPLTSTAHLKARQTAKMREIVEALVAVLMDDALNVRGSSCVAMATPLIRRRQS
jgi:hypothetical protein